MSLQGRVFFATALVLLVPFLVVAGLIRTGIKSRLTDLYVDRVESSARLIEEDLNTRGQDLTERLNGLKEELLDDNQFRRSLIQQGEDLTRYRIGCAERLMKLSGLNMLQIQEASGRILSSGHFRNSYDQIDPSLAQMPIRPGGKTTLIQTRAPEGDLLALGQRVPFRMGETEYSIVGGMEIAGALMRGIPEGSDQVIRIVYPHPVRSADPWIQKHVIQQAVSTASDPVLNPDAYFVHEVGLFFVASDGTEPGRGEAVLMVGHSRLPLRNLLKGLDLWLGLYLLVIMGGTLLLARWISGRISKPLRELAEEVTSVDVDRLNVEFASDRGDEVGELSRFLTGMTERLRASVAKLREAERRAAFADLSRQVNHDIRNGFTPIRNVVRHLAQVAEENPEELGRVFAERRAQIESGLVYLEELAASYARISPRRDRQAVDLNSIVHHVCEDLCVGEQRAVRLQLQGDLPAVDGDPVGMRRIVENLVRNAAESLVGSDGEVSVKTDVVVEGASRSVVLTVADTGKGIPSEQIDQVFEHFYTTKAQGTGLGLSIVRRLVQDFGGWIDLDSEAGVGTRVVVRFPSVEASERTASGKEP